MYNSRTYQIDRMSYDQTPKTFTMTWTRRDPVTKEKETMKTNLIEYYKIKYGLTIKDPLQPMLISGQAMELVYILPELCHRASLGKDFTKDRAKIKQL